MLILKILRLMVWTMDAIMGMAGGTLRFAYLQGELKAEILTQSKDQYSELIPIISDISIVFWRNGSL